MTETSSSAKRLYGTLILLQKSAKEGSELLKVTIGKAFGISEKDTTRLLAIYLEMIKLVQQTKLDIEKISDEVDKELYIEPLERLETAFSSNSLVHQWANFSQYLDPTTMKSLQFCADILSRRMGEKLVSDEELETLRKDVDELFELIVDSDLDLLLKNFLLERLEQIRHALLYYRLNGSKGLKDALEKIVGAGFVFNAINGNSNFGEKAREILPKFGKIFVALMKLVEFGNNIKGLTDSNFPLLSGK